MSQIALPLDWPADEAGDAFIVSSANEAAVRHLGSTARWPVCATIVYGPRKSGRSLLGRIFAIRTGGTLIDDAERHDEAGIFHAWNVAQTSRKPLLLIADSAYPAWEVHLPDLRSRLAATQSIAIGEPDEMLAGRLIARFFERRGLAALPEVLAYLTPRVERTYVAIIALVDALDAASLAQRRQITVPFARDILQTFVKVDAAPAAF